MLICHIFTYWLTDQRIRYCLAFYVTAFSDNILTRVRYLFLLCLVEKCVDDLVMCTCQVQMVCLFVGIPILSLHPPTPLGVGTLCQPSGPPNNLSPL
jgi:hypothetical protein